jgi:flavin reductase (DIM6/NTAB) family NADH-FMN oxidoreductase RutF
MELRWTDKSLKKLITNVGLVTSNGPHGPDVMACEYTYKISTDPGLMAIAVRPGYATADNITKSKEFGISIAATDQNELCSIAGNTSGKEYNKIKLLEELGFRFYKAKRIKAPMVAGSVINIECGVVHEFRGGDHILFIGEVLEKEDHPEKEPLAYHKSRYWAMDTNLPKPSKEELEKKLDSLLRKHKKAGK